jgi:hypothetical protein
MKTRIVVALIAITVLLGPGISYARMYNTSTGRFQTMDTYEGNQEEPQSCHKYTYAADNPVNKIDPSGNDFELGALSDIGGILSSLDSFLNVGALAVERLAADKDDNTTKILWSETGSVYPGLKAGTKESKYDNWDSGSRESLNKAREKIAAIINAGKLQVAKPKALPDVSNPKTTPIWEKAQVDDVRAARKAAGNNTSTDKMCMWPSDDGGKTPSSSPEEMKASWPYDYKPSESYGAFRVLARKSGDPVPVSDKVYIFFYNNVP